MMDRVAIEARLAGSLQAVAALSDMADQLADACNALVDAMAQGRRLFSAGNGGSAAEAMHLTEELIGRYRADRKPLPAMCLNADPTALTCIANDFGYDAVFERQLRALLQPGDVFAALSTSGNSPNIVNAARVARRSGAVTIGLLGRDGGACAELCDHALIIPGDDSAHIQEAHLVIVHLLCEAVERQR